MNIALPSKELWTTPYHIFPGDDPIASETYTACMQGRYSRLAMPVIGAALNFEVDLDGETGETWKRVTTAMGQLDNFLDEPSQSDRKQALELYRQGIDHFRTTEPQWPEWADSLLEPSVRLLQNAFLSLPDERTTRLLNAAVRIGDISAQKAACSGVLEYVRLLKEEGRLAGELIVDSASEDVYGQPAYKNFSHWFVRGTQAGTFSDSAYDLAKDNETSLTKVAPTAWNKAIIGTNGLLASAATLSGKNKLAATRAGISVVRWFKAKSG